MTTHNDDATIRRITTELGTNFIVEAGAGIGKTYALVKAGDRWAWAFNDIDGNAAIDGEGGDGSA